MEADNLFNNNIAQKAFKKFLKFGKASSMEASISAFLCFHAIITDVGDSLQLSLEKPQDRFFSEKEIVSVTTDEGRLQM